MNDTIKNALLKLHFAIFLAGTSGLFGKWVSLSETALVWYRILLSLLVLGGILIIGHRLHRIPLKQFLRISCAGAILVAHWVFFYASIQASNVSVGVICLSAVAFITAILEPIFSKNSHFSRRDILYSIISVFGILCIFSFDSSFRIGIVFGLISSTLVALLMIANKQLRTIKIKASSWQIFFIELISGFIVLSLYIGVSALISNGFSIDATSEYLALNFSPTDRDLIFLIILAAVVTITPYSLKIDSLKHISAFTVNLANNMEPVYSIILAAIFFHEFDELNFSFVIGVILIVLSVVLQNLAIKKSK